MADYRPGDSVALEFRVLDLNGDAVTGLTASDFTISVSERTTGAYSSSGESTTVTERSAGWYTLSFTLDSDASGRTYAVEVTEKSSITLSAEQTHRFWFTVGTLTDLTEDDAWCSVNDIEAKLQRGGRSSSSAPTQSQTVDFAAWRAAELQAFIWPIYPVTVASGSNPLGSSDDKDIALGRMLRDANATIAAADVLMAGSLAERGTIPDEVVVYHEDYKRKVDRLDRFLHSAFATRFFVTSSSDQDDIDDLFTTDTTW